MMRRPLGRRGTSALEFAFLAPVFLLMALGVIEVGLQGAVSAALNIGARSASRLGITGGVGASGTNGAVASDSARVSAVKSAVLTASGGLLQDGRLTVTQQTFNTIADAAAGQNAASGPGGAGRFVRYTLTYLQPTFAGDWNKILSGLFHTSASIPATFTHTSTILVTNEPFPS